MSYKLRAISVQEANLYGATTHSMDATSQGKIQFVATYFMPLSRFQFKRQSEILGPFCNGGNKTLFPVGRRRHRRPEMKDVENGKYLIIKTPFGGWPVSRWMSPAGLARGAFFKLATRWQRPE